MNRMVSQFVASAAILFCLLAAPIFAQQAAGPQQERLKELLKRYPQADTNKDGVLTIEEARAYRQQAGQRPQAQQPGRDLPPQSVKPDAANVKYGPHDRNVLDLWLAKGAGPRPLVVFIHGGGWIGGDKVMISPEHIRRFTAAGITVASINYRFSTIEPFPTPLRDGGLAIQFLRHRASEYNIDPKRVAAYGGSAGAVTSLWLAFHDDFADPKATDPVLRQSTRLTCAGSIVGPTTIDKKTMDEWFGMKVVTHPAMLPFFGVKTEEDLYSEKVRKAAAEASPINHLTRDDPPVFLDFPQDLAPLSAKHTPGEMVHHPLFGVKLKEAMDKIGVESNFQAKNRPQDKYKDQVDFLTVKLTKG